MENLTEFKKELSRLSGVDFFNPKFRDVFKKLENKKDGKTLDISKAIKNNLVYLRNVCESVQKRTGQKIDKVKSFIIDNFEKYFS